MSILDIARDTLKGLPLSDLVRERLSLALDRLADAEAKIADLQAQNGVLRAENARLQTELESARQELQRLRDEHAEEIRVFKGVEFRRGKRTAGQWIAFCPVCHLPADTTSGLLRCASGRCDWDPIVSEETARQWAAAF